MPKTQPISKRPSQSWTWIWFSYTGFLFILPVVEPTRLLWIGTIAVIAVFAPIYYGYIWSAERCHPLRFWMIGATFALGLFTFPWNQGASCFFIYAASFFPFIVKSTRLTLWFLAADALIVLAEGFLFNQNSTPWGLHIGWINTFIAAFMVLLIGGSNAFFAEHRRAEEKLRGAQEENLALAALAERERIARDLHDVLGHTLSVIVLKAELAGRLIPINPARATAEIADIERITRTALAEVREAIGGYRARGLAAEIDAARLTLDAAGVTLLAESDPQHHGALSSQEETALALVLREAITNIVRHARATTCRLRFVNEEGQRRLVVEDDGQHGQAREGNGLRGMRERVESLGGNFSLERGVLHNRGTRLTVALPMREAAAL